MVLIWAHLSLEILLACALLGIKCNRSFSCHVFRLWSYVSHPFLFFQVMVWMARYDWSLRRVCSHSLARPTAYCRWLGTERIIFAATSHKNGSTISAGSSFPRVRETAIFSTFQIQWELFTYCSYLWLRCSFKSYDLFRAFIILWIPLIRSTLPISEIECKTVLRF